MLSPFMGPALCKRATRRQDQLAVGRSVPTPAPRKRATPRVLVLCACVNVLLGTCNNDSSVRYQIVSMRGNTALRNKDQKSWAVSALVHEGESTGRGWQCEVRMTTRERERLDHVRYAVYDVKILKINSS